MDIGATARLLVETRKADIRLPSLPSPSPDSLSQAYQIQDATIPLMGSVAIGWKVGATSIVGMRALGVKQPLAGPLFQGYSHKSPAKISTHEDSMCIIEAEFAFSMKSDLPPRDTDYTLEEISAAIAAIHPAIEVVNTRCIDGFAAGANWVVADFTANEAFIYGKGIENWQQFDLARHQTSVEINGALKGSGTGAAVLGNPLNVLHWLANHLSSRNITLKADDFVSTGLTTPVITGLKGDMIEADFGPLGLVELEIQ